MKLLPTFFFLILFFNTARATINGLDTVESASITEQIKGTNGIFRQDLIASAKEYKAFKQKNREAVRIFKRAAKKQLRKINHWNKYYDTTTTEEDIDREFESELLSKGSKLGMIIHCELDVGSYQPIIFSRAKSTDCRKIKGSDLGFLLKLNYWGIGPGLGLQVSKLNSLCMLDFNNQKVANVNFGLKTNLSIGIGMQGGITFGMNGLCLNYGMDIGFGAGVSIGMFTIQKQN